MLGITDPLRPAIASEDHNCQPGAWVIIPTRPRAGRRRPHRGTTSEGATRLLRLGHQHNQGRACHHSADDVPQGSSIPRWSWNGPGTLVASFDHCQIKAFHFGPGAHDLGENQHVSLEEIVDRLYALSPDAFTGARNQAERELRKAGEQEQADEVRALRKPTAAAGAANRLVREHRPEVDAFLAAAAGLRDAQFADKGDVASAASAQRDALEKLVGFGGEPVRATLQAAAVDDNTARDLLAGRLVREPEPAGFGTLLAHSEPKAAKASTATRAAPWKQAASAPAAPDDRAAQTQLREAKKALGAGEAEERQAKRRWAQTQRDLEKARAAVDRAQRELDRLHGR